MKEHLQPHCWSGEAADYLNVLLNEWVSNPWRIFPGKIFDPYPGQTWKQYEPSRSQKTTQEAKTIVSELQNLGDHVDEKERSNYLQRLEQLGYNHVVLAFEADRMDRNDNLVNSIQLRTDLLRLLPKDDPRSNLSLLSKYAKSLEVTWQLSEACTYLSMVHRSTPDRVDVDHLEKLKYLSKIVEENDDWIIDPDLPIDTVIHVSTVLEKQFKGRYVLRKLTPILCGKHTISSNQIAEKYNQIRQESQHLALPVAVPENMWLISTTGGKLVPTIGFVPKKT